MSLALIGALVIVAVFAYNKWQEHRAVRATDETFRSRHPDVLIGGQAGLAPQFETDQETRVEPGISPRKPSAETRSAADDTAPLIPNPRIDYVMDMGADEPVSVAALQELWSAVEHRFARRTSIAIRTDDRWEPLQPRGTWQNLRAALQLVNRKGVVSEGELLEFRSAVETLATKLRAHTTSPEMRDALDAARSLDDICAGADIQVAFHVVAAPRTAFAGTKLRAAAEASGFILGDDGRFTLADDDGRELYGLADRSGTLFAPETMKDAAPNALTLSMDVPRAPDTQRTFDAMVRFGRHLANLLGGGLVDDNNQPLDEKAVATINSQLAMVRQNLEAHGISPGSALALRLFS